MCVWLGVRWLARAVSAERRGLSASWILNTPLFRWTKGEEIKGGAGGGNAGVGVGGWRIRGGGGGEIHGFAQGGGHQMQERGREGK